MVVMLPIPRLARSARPCSGIATTTGKLQPKRKTERQRRVSIRAEGDDADARIEALEQNLKGSASKAKRAAKRKAEQANRPFQVDAPVRDAIASGDLTEAQVFEGQIITLLVTVFSLCILEGILIGASGFLPDAADQFIADYVFKAFSPTVGFFLLCSTAYGLWKTRNDPDSVR